MRKPREAHISEGLGVVEDATVIDATVVDGTASLGEVPSGGRGAPAELLCEGAAIGDYMVERVLGSGGFGIVYAARHSVLGHRVAIKALRTEVARHPKAVARFVLEATAISKIGHRSIVDIHAFGETASGAPYYVMELLEGMDLREYLRGHGHFAPKEMLSLLAPMCEAVQAAHEAGFVHRDIKTSNIVVVEREGERLTKLLDFGIAKMTESDHPGQGLTEPGAQLGSAHTMAPEQIQGERVDARTDIYALGVVIYQLLTGQYPFDADQAYKITLQHLRAPAPRPSTVLPVPPALDAVVLRCLEKAPEKRFASVSELLSALYGAVGEERGGAALSSSAIGVYVSISGYDDEDMDDAMCSDMGSVLDTVEETLASHGFTVPLHISGALLGVQLVEQDDIENAQQRAQELVDELRAELLDRPFAHPRVEVSLRTSLQLALYRQSADGVEIVGGPILDVGGWC